MLLRCESLDPPMSQMGQTRTSSLGAARPLPPRADIGPRGQSVGQAAQFCLGCQDDDDLHRHPGDAARGHRCRR